MGIKLSDLAENTRIVFHIHHDDNQMDLGGVLKKQVEDNIALIGLDYTGPQRLVFDNVTIDMEWPQENGIPILWTNVKSFITKTHMSCRYPAMECVTTDAIPSVFL